MATLARHRCFHHGEREAVARCPSCWRHYCRECVAEHDGRLLCASCIAAAATSAEAGPAVIPAWRTAARFVLSVVVLWAAFWAFGRVLLAVPTPHHNALQAPGESTAEDWRVVDE